MKKITFWILKVFTISVSVSVIFTVIYLPLIFDLDPKESITYLTTVIAIERAGFYLRNKVI